MLFRLNNFSYSPQLTPLSQSHTRSSSQFFAESGLSASENSDSVGLTNEGLEVIIAGILRFDRAADVWADEGRLEEVEESGAG